MLKFNYKAVGFMLSLFTLIACADIYAGQKNCCRDSGRRHVSPVVPAQANYQNANSFIPGTDVPISFPEENFNTNFLVNEDRSVFTVKIPGLYSLDSFLLLNVPNIGDTVQGFITINGKKLLPFTLSVRRDAGPIVNFHFFDRLVYLRQCDELSVVLSSFPAGTTIDGGGVVFIALNNSF